MRPKAPEYLNRESWRCLLRQTAVIVVDGQQTTRWRRLSQWPLQPRASGSSPATYGGDVLSPMRSPRLLEPRKFWVSHKEYFRPFERPFADHVLFGSYRPGRRWLLMLPVDDGELLNSFEVREHVCSKPSPVDGTFECRCRAVVIAWYSVGMVASRNYRMDI